jgi:hypothetical protein
MKRVALIAMTTSFGVLGAPTSAIAEGASVVFHNCSSQDLTMNIAPGGPGCTAPARDRCSSPPQGLGPHDLTASDGNSNIVAQVHIDLGPTGYEWTVGGECS